MADAVVPTAGTHLLATHPSTDRTPRAYLAVHDPTAPAATGPLHAMPCWVIGCGCADMFDLVPVERTVMVEALALSADHRPPSSRSRPSGPTPVSGHPNRPHSGSEGFLDPIGAGLTRVVGAEPGSQGAGGPRGGEGVPV